MRALHGNTAADAQTCSWKANHKLMNHTVLAIGGINVGGFSDSPKWEAIKEMPHNVLVLTETHIQTHLVKSYPYNFPNYFTFWSPGEEQKYYNGIGLLVRRSKCWAATQLTWKPEDACHRFWQDSRLLAAQLWLGQGGTTILLYGVYGPSGARWERAKRQYFNAMMQAIAEDIAARGDMPSFVIGDFNMVINDSHLLQQLLRNGGWFDCRRLGSEDMRRANTCHVQGGSQIDHIFASRSAYDQAFGYKVRKHVEFKSHSMVEIALQVPLAAQTRTTLRNVCKIPPRAPPVHEHHLVYNTQLGRGFWQALAQNDLDKAYQLWCEETERILISVANKQGHHVLPGAVKRGNVVFHEQRRFPRTVQESASTLLTRSIWKALCRAREVAKATPGFRRDKTWEATSKLLKHIPRSDADELRPLLGQPASIEAANAVVDALNKLLEKQHRQDRFARLNAWKKRMRNNDNECYGWLRSKARQEPVRVTVTAAGATADTQARLNAIKSVWERIYMRHQHGEPKLVNFMQKYGATLNRKVLDLPPLHEDDMMTTILEAKPTSAGMDGIMPVELRHLAQWCPTHIRALTALLRKVEDTGKWPSVATCGAVAFVAKDPAQVDPQAGDFRPITILASVYRAWASCRQKQLAQKWVPHWQDPGTYGLPGGCAADVLAYETCAQVIQAANEGQVAAGLSYDLRKCFDTGPINLSLDIFRQRGADSGVLRALTGFYDAHHKYFKIDGFYAKKFTAANGILQGCPLSMLLLVSMVMTWLEAVRDRVPTATPKSFANDLSVVDQSQSLQQVKHNLRLLHDTTCEFTQATGAQINNDKSFVFGSKSVQGSVPDLPNYKHTFRLVGGSVKLSAGQSWTPLERERGERWVQTVRQVRRLPVGWFAKVKILRSTVPKLTFGQGTHTLPVARDYMRHLRAEMVRSLFNMNDYSLSPQTVFTLLAPPALEPAFALQLAAFRLVQRVCNTPRSRRILVQQLASTRQQPPSDGPLARILQLKALPSFKPLVEDFLHNRLEGDKWQHDLRESWREQTWKTLARERAQHFAGAEKGVNRKATLAYLQDLTAAADALQIQQDSGQHELVPPSEDPRAKLKVLRLLLTAGLMTPERDHRHRRRKGIIRCACGGPAPTIEHISWYCKCYHRERREALQVVPNFRGLPVCFRLCTLVTSNMKLSDDKVRAVQRSLVAVWQAHIAAFGDGVQELAEIIAETPSGQPAGQQQPDAGSTVSMTLTRQPADRRGHALKLIPSGGVYCQKCGKQTKNVKHQRLKILNKKCAFPDLPVEEWLQEPGALRSASRLQQAERDLHERLSNGHRLVWNRKVGKQADREDYGKLWCSVCGKEWPWKDRHRGASKVRCRPLPHAPDTPEWVRALSLEQQNAPQQQSPPQHHSTPTLRPDNTQQAQHQHSFPGTGLVLPVRHRIVVNAQ